MAMVTEELPGGITKVILDGRLDIEGAAAMDLPMNVIAGSQESGARRLAERFLPRVHGLAGAGSASQRNQRPRRQSGFVWADRIGRKGFENQRSGYAHSHLP